jgi:hypothetical protein
MTTTTAEKAKPITLHEWAEAQFAHVPHVNTLRKWARTKQIRPCPQLVGREYLVLPHARYVGKAKK